MSAVTMYTDGSCLGNPGPGGYGVVLVSGDNHKELSQGFRDTTNNRMELRAVIEGLSALKHRCSVELYTDSKYVQQAITLNWIGNWQKNGWKTAAKKPVKNKDLWLRLLPLIKAHDVTFKWVKGHSGHPENERCDELARNAASGSGLLPDIQPPD